MSQITATLRQISQFDIAEDSIAISQLPRLIDDWLADYQIRQFSPRTNELRRGLTDRLLWFLRERSFTE